MCCVDPWHLCPPRARVSTPEFSAADIVPLHLLWIYVLYTLAHMHMMECMCIGGSQILSPSLYHGYIVHLESTRQHS